MKCNITTPALTLLFNVAGLAASRTVTLTVNRDVGRANATLTIQPFETVEVLTRRVDSGEGDWKIIKDGNELSPGGSSADYQPPILIVVAGPAVFTLTTWQPLFDHSWVTGKLTPETDPAQDAIVVPAGPYGAVVNLRASTNLLNWTNVFSVAYTNEPTSLFFRVRLDATANVMPSNQPAPLFTKGTVLR